MKNDRISFEEYISTLDYDGLKKTVMDEHSRCMELEIREESNARINTEMHIQYIKLKDKYEKLQKSHDELKVLYQKEIEKNILKTRSTFGRSTEKFTDLIDAAADRTNEFEDENQEEENEEVFSKKVIPFPGKRTGSTKKSAGNKGDGSSHTRSRLKRSLENLPHEIVYDMDIDSLNRMFGEGNWRIAFWHKHEVLEKIPVSYYVREVYTPVISYGLGHELYTIPYTNVLMPHSYVSASVLADILYRKFVLGLPFYRQASDFMMSGVALLKQTIIHWVNTLTPDLLDPVYDHLVSLLIKTGYIQSDETFLQVNKDGLAPGHKSFMWVHCSGELLDCDPVVIFCYEATRGTDHLRRLFGEFLGYITCDAYISYKVLEDENAGITVTGCLMHCRRYFAEALFVNDLVSLKDEDIAELPETKILLLIRKIYTEENGLKCLSAEDRYTARQERVKAHVDELFEYIHYLNGSDEIRSDRMHKALTYAINQEEKLRMFLDDGNIPCDNGLSERIIRSYSIGRSNWLFADTVQGAMVNATIYSLVETAKANKVNVRLYLQYVIGEMSRRKTLCDPPDREFLDKMMPWSTEYRAYENEISQSGMDTYRRMFPEPSKPRTPRKKDATDNNRSPLHPKTALAGSTRGYSPG